MYAAVGPIINYYIKDIMLLCCKSSLNSILTETAMYFLYGKI